MKHNYRIVKRNNLYYIQNRVFYFFWWDVKFVRLAKKTSFCYDIQEKYESDYYENLQDAKDMICEFRDLLKRKKTIVVEKYIV